jgi:hypothetical protein
MIINNPSQMQEVSGMAQSCRARRSPRFLLCGLGASLCDLCVKKRYRNKKSTIPARYATSPQPPCTSYYNRYGTAFHAIPDQYACSLEKPACTERDAGTTNATASSPPPIMLDALGAIGALKRHPDRRNRPSRQTQSRRPSRPPAPETAPRKGTINLPVYPFSSASFWPSSALLFRRKRPGA